MLKDWPMVNNMNFILSCSWSQLLESLPLSNVRICVYSTFAFFFSRYCTPAVASYANNTIFEKCVLNKQILEIYVSD